MHVIIAGCGRVGAQLATRLDAEGHAVVVVDKNAEAFRRLSEGFGGRTEQGFVFDQETLERAGVRQAQAFVAVTSGDNSNIVSARIARDHYDVEHVVARIYDPERARIYERLGVTTIASARWTVEVVLDAIFGPDAEQSERGLGPGPSEVVLIDATVPSDAHGIPISSVSVSGESALVAVTRGGATRVPATEQVLEAGDRLHLAVDQAAVEATRERIRALGSRDADPATALRRRRLRT